MFNKLNIFSAIGVCVILLLGAGCAKTIHGYLSNDIYYTVNPFQVQQGVTTVSAPLVLNGSSAPLHVELSALRDSAGNDADSILMKPQSILTYKSTVTVNDSTLDLLNAKLNDSLVRPFNIAETGGRLQFTAATNYVPTGSYTMDLTVSNINGVKFLKNACTIVIEPLTITSSLGYFSYRPNDPTGTTQLFRTESDPTYSNFDITHEDTQGETKIVLKFVDKNGVPFNPNAGEVQYWSNVDKSTTSFPQLNFWAPYYAPTYTDSTIVTKLPNIAVSFPYFDLNNAYPAARGARIDNKITGLSSNEVIHTVMYFTLYTVGTYYITYHLLVDTHK
ncbi:MAG TPA: hypothetical protein VNS58_14630 [Puia sp.]|nr:hypothetical protein [Puia sp.]